MLRRMPYYYHILKDQIQLTDLCIKEKEIQRKQSSRFAGQFLRLGVDGGQGCSGFKYQFNFDKTLSEEDHVLLNNDQPLFAVDEITLRFVQGCVVDYEDKMIRAAFYVFQIEIFRKVQENPNAEKSCSCKVSFSPKEGLI
ncbi:hypothetical protein pb186bvf_011965 [Paramecium bursaria]